ncbi:D-alanyl-D-alanine carboxypeptidase [Georgenia sp. TF02-10]|uniref:D-alanyl-D-alanine carboxypeptidase/D-alanyl-D-alanine-endopeptidase n=1 Tax=Georgenia sp. TF02-10 TaxID=2917725 RepID=UPI001FA8090D|nr:D-alanyl-D-alanine carboxypeptidase [Georgenia sp. TF02-10]UNX54489.1 D-alanyl-D-alanine carboxypeptidase [Georgenia sp. TF02-10]
MGRRGTIAALAVVALLGGYGTADAADVVPGVLTTEPAPADPVPFPGLALPGPLQAPEVAGADPEAPAPTTAGLEQAVAALQEDPRVTGSVGVVVADGLTGETLLAQDPGTARTPASTLKLLTAAAALDALGPARTLTTRVVQPEPDQVVLVGGGDVLLAAGAGDGAAVNGRAGLADLAADTAAALTDQGTTSVRVSLDDSLFTGPTLAPGWGGADLNYVMPIQALAVDAGRTSAGYPEDPALDAAEAFTAALGAAGVTVSGPVSRTTGFAGSAGDAASEAEGTGGTDAADGAGERAADGEGERAADGEGEREADGAGARAADAESEPAADGAPTIATAESAPVGAVVRYALKESENSVTEVLARLVAVERGLPADFAGAVAAVQAQLSDLGVDLAGADLRDTSGLDMAGRVPPRALADVLTLAATGGTAHGGTPDGGSGTAESDGGAPTLAGLLPGLPVGGLDGTLGRRLTGEEAGRVRAKTGTLTVASALAGTVVTADGRLLVFAALADGLQVGTTHGARAALDDFAATLAGCGCGSG